MHKKRQNYELLFKEKADIFVSAFAMLYSSGDYFL